MCPFCNPSPETIVTQSEASRIIRVSAGHVVVVPRVHVVPGQWINAGELYGAAHHHGRSLRTEFHIASTFTPGSPEHMRIHLTHA